VKYIFNKVVGDVLGHKLRLSDMDIMLYVFLQLKAETLTRIHSVHFVVGGMYRSSSKSLVNERIKNIRRMIMSTTSLSFMPVPELVKTDITICYID
jgi:hypothetical protein